ncbi:MAG: 30S ribosomal protein S17P [Methanosaeta sp. PtaB.Bin039]|nr:MAG: 30S ribosomal protein S17P [Methanosaeta sp. PtaB.Bin039]HOT07481.1 30S ribosomal protein S17 [Methanotrichaceae archaeon]HQF16994.1 30S ribosomal protein S17 [Methanotrichaceae archaeon]HQI91614.1 30S ribosomal protein S17 [Methanotrichaceae archaeon]HQJ28892.1 30S ribosomal protein S17 [Methanotrichaceae archaeon]
MRDIGLDVGAPSEACSDPKCPFHGSLSVRGQVLDGIVVSDKMSGTVVVMREFEKKNQKYERSEKRRSKIHAHNPPCLAAKAGEHVKIAECRPLSKTKTFVVVEVRR